MDEERTVSSDSTMRGRKPLGWKAMPYILANETLERLASFGLKSNFMVYMVRGYHMDQVQAATLINTWSALTNFAPIIGAFISDSCTGKFVTIVFGSISELLGMVVLTLTSLIPTLRPPPCTTDQITGTCARYSDQQLYVLLSGLFLLSLGTGGIRSCSIPFSLDQFDDSTEEGREGSRSFFSWYYTTHTIVQLISMTLVLYVQNNISWAIGFAIPTTLNLFALVLLFVGVRFYVFVRPQGSVFSGIFKVLVDAYKKRNAQPPYEIEQYQPLLETSSQSNKLVLTDQFRFLDKAAVIIEGDLTPEGVPANKWRLCSIQEVEEVKCLIRIVPVWSAGIISLAAMSQQGTFTVSQALKMDRHMGPNFEIPACSLSVISLLTIGVFLPLYDRVLVPFLRRITGHKSGITLLQRIGTGIVFAIFSMIVAGLVERMRRTRSINAGDPTGMTPMSVFWLSPQLILMGLCEAFNIIGQIEFFNSQFPEHMRSIANSLFSLSFAGSNYLSSLIVTIVHEFSGGHDRPDWLNKNLNAGKLDYFYYLIAVLGVFNLVYFWYCARGYRYKVGLQMGDFEENKSFSDVEMSSGKKQLK
ncbi:hypothetical protein Bca52824_014763 [Brassica carinata]|uniref:Protein NRT1/ PTR FAMILY 2.13-like n=1 Tax=Brassica carinata TaxID=52824 RepID=A0A8X8B3R3_BRACI|nr:hypothetical protein Bca52824_014763 [Brassica carinata]